MDPIYKTFFGRYIDLAKVCDISDVSVAHDNVLSFQIRYQLSEKPLTFSRGPVEKDRYDFLDVPRDESMWVWLEDYYGPQKSKGFHSLIFVTSEGHEAMTIGSYPSIPKDAKLLAQIHLQAQVDEIVTAWRAYRAWENGRKFGASPQNG